MTYTSWQQVPKGTKFIVTKNSNSHNYPMGVELQVSKSLKGLGTAGIVLTGYNTLSISDVTFLAATITKEALLEEICKAEKIIEKAKEKLDFLENTKQEIYDPTEHALNVAITMLSRSKKEIDPATIAKVITKIIKDT